MNLREKIENNLVIWLLATLFAGFMAGIGAYKAILEIAQLEVVPRARRDESQGTRLGSGVSSQTPTTGSADTEAQEATTIFKLSSKLPFPENLDAIQPGMRLSEARTVFPNGEMTPAWYKATIDSGPFHYVAFFVFGRGDNPPIDVIHFQFRNKSAKSAVLATLLRELGSKPHRTEMLGERIVWPDVNGFQLDIGDSYNISTASVQDETGGEEVTPQP